MKITTKLNSRELEYLLSALRTAAARNEEQARLRERLIGKLKTIRGLILDIEYRVTVLTKEAGPADGYSGPMLCAKKGGRSNERD